MSPSWADPAGRLSLVQSVEGAFAELEHVEPGLTPDLTRRRRPIDVGTPVISADIAAAKARTAALGRRETKAYEDMINQGRTAFLSAPVLQGMLEGGVPVMVEGHCLGAIGVSGVKSSEDAQVARARVLGQVADRPGTPHHPRGGLSLACEWQRRKTTPKRRRMERWLLLAVI